MKKVMNLIFICFLLSSCRVVKGVLSPVILPIQSISETISEGINDYKPKKKDRYAAYQNKAYKEKVSRITLHVLDREMESQVVKIYNRDVNLIVPKNIVLKVIDYNIEMVDKESGYGLPIVFYSASNPCLEKSSWDKDKYKDKYFKKLFDDEYVYIESYTYDGKELENKIIKVNNMKQICKNTENMEEK